MNLSRTTASQNKPSRPVYASEQTLRIKVRLRPFKVTTRLNNLWTKASAPNDEVERRKSYNLAIATTIPEMQTASCFSNKERHESILA